jgi:double-stranded uracil-DNA glycosylase
MGEPLALASPRKVPDVISPDLDVLFLGVNPGLRSGAVGHHFAHPSSRFWKALHASGFTPRLLSAFEEADLLGFGLGLTNLVDRTTASARDLHREELREGARRLEAKATRYRPRWVAVLGIGAYRRAFDRPEAQLGAQPDRIATSSVWVLPGPSGLNAHYPMPAAIEAFRRFRQAVSSAGS